MHVVLQCNTRTYIYGEIQFCYLFWHVTFSKFCHFLVDKFIISWGQHENIRDSRHARLSKKKGMLPWKNSIHKKFLSFFGLGLILIYLLDIKILSETSSTVISALSSIYMHYGCLFLVPFRLTKNLLDWFLLCCYYDCLRTMGGGGGRWIR